MSEDIEKLRKGYTRNFKELKSEEQKQVVNDQIAEVRTQINITLFQHREFLKTKDILDFITRCKLQFIPPSVANEHVPHPEMPPEISRAYVEIYERYERVLEANGWIDYANQLLLANELLRDVPEVKKEWQEKFELIFVDEYQDTDPVQYCIINVLADHHENVRVVGDDDQGIYSFRGADIQNILNFENNYSTVKIIPLGENYRSTQRIVDASRALAAFNPDRREKELFTRNSEGKNIIHLHCKSAEKEVDTITSFIISAIQYGWRYKDFAILCRLNSQVDEFKTAFNSLGIPSDGVSVMTIYKAKGLEFPNVFVAGVCKGLLPFAGNTENEERRLLYVAMTRAENWLCLSSYENDAGSNVNGRSPFLDQIPGNLLEPTQILGDSHIPPKPIKSNETESSTVVEKPLESITHLPTRPEIVLGIDPGKIDANNPNVGWAVTEKSSNGYTVIDCDTETPKGTSVEKLKQIEDKINELIALHSPDAIAVERLEGATDRGLIGVAGCVALVRSIADQHGIERAFYSPQQVKYAATSNRNADKEQVQEGVKKRCNFPMAQNNNNIDDHSADAIAVSLCYLDSYLNSSRLQRKKRKQEHYDSGLVYLGNGQYDAAVAEFKEAINTDPIYTEAHCELGRAYLGQNKLIEAENSANEALRLDPKYQPARELLNTIKQEYYKRGVAYIKDNEYGKAILGQNKLIEAENSANEALRLDPKYQPARELLNTIKQEYYKRGVAYIEDNEYAKAINRLLKASSIDPNDKKVYTSLGRAYYWQDDYANAAIFYQKATNIDTNDKTAHSNLGNAYYYIGAYADAINSLQKASTLDSNCEKTLYYLARTYFRQGKWEQAKRTTQKTLSIVPTYQLARKLLDNIKWASDHQMIMVPAGDFQIESNDSNAEVSKNPMRTTYVDEFYIDIYPVTNAQYKKFVDENPEWQKERISSKYYHCNYLQHWNRNNYPHSKGDHPVTYVSWYAAMAYAQWTGKRLPTESEWEKAARGGLTGLEYPWGNLIDSNKANYGREFEGTTPVGHYVANSYGLYDMVGNVWEWCFDEYNPYKNFSRRNRTACADDIKRTVSNFTNVKTSRVLRGGSWYVDVERLRIAYRFRMPPTNLNYGSGFRCVRDAIT